MAWCPNCKEEYRDGFFKCADCGAILVDKLPQESNIQKNTDFNIHIEPCLLISVSDEIQAKLIEGLLKNSNIPFYTKDRECGGYLKIYMGYSVFGTDIYVDKSNYDKAKEVVDACLNETDNENDEPYDQFNENDNRSFVARKMVMRVIIFIMVFSIVLSFLSIGFSMVGQLIFR
jgi:hypothetical protein